MKKLIKTNWNIIKTNQNVELSHWTYKLIRNKEAMYNILEAPPFNYVIPKIDSKAIIFEYLYGLAKKEFYCPTKDKWRKVYIIRQNYNNGFIFSEKSLAYTLEKPPSKLYLLDFLFTYKSDHKFFKFSVTGEILRNLS